MDAGLWLQDLRAAMSLATRNSHTLIGTDITSIYFPSPLPEGIDLFEQSIKKPWPESWNESFDFVHQRMALPAAGKTEVLDALRAFVGLVKPGGWIQLVEPDHSVSRGPAMSDFFRLLNDIFTVMGTGPDYAKQLKKWMQAELGLVEVEERIFDIPVGHGSCNETMASKSSKMLDLVVEGLIQVAQGMLIRAACIPPTIEIKCSSGLSVLILNVAGKTFPHHSRRRR